MTSTYHMWWLMRFCTVCTIFNAYRTNPEQKEKNNLNFYFHTSLWCFKRFYEGLKGLHKTFWRTTKKCENKNLTWFLFQYNFQKCTGRSIRQMNGLRFCKIQKKYFKKPIVFLSVETNDIKGNNSFAQKNFQQSSRNTSWAYIRWLHKNLLDLFTSFYAFGDT